MDKCAVCGKVAKEMMVQSGVPLCRQCVPDIRVEVDRLRATKKPINISHIARRIYRQKHSAGNYLLRDIPQELWTKAKHRAIDDETTLRDLILKSVAEYIKQ